MDRILCLMDDSRLPFPFNPVLTGSNGLSDPPSGALLPCRASVPSVAKPCPGCPSTPPTLDATGALLSLRLGTLSEGSCFVCLGVPGLRHLGEDTQLA